MVKKLRIDRRGFLKIAAFTGVVGTVAGFGYPVYKYLSPPQQETQMPRSLLVDENGNPIKASELEVNKMYLFNYPLVNTPNILINLGDENGNPVKVEPLRIPLNMEPLNEPSYIVGGQTENLAEHVPATAQLYEFPGGVGPSQSIVAYSAICQHLGCVYPQLKYVPPGQPTEFPTNPPIIGERGGVLFCRCHGSTFDPYRGAIVLSEPSLRPLPTIVLEWEKDTDNLYAVNVVGPVIFGRTCNTCGGDPVGDKVVVKKSEL